MIGFFLQLKNVFFPSALSQSVLWRTECNTVSGSTGDHDCCKIGKKLSQDAFRRLTLTLNDNCKPAEREEIRRRRVRPTSYFFLSCPSSSRLHLFSFLFSFSSSPSHSVKLPAFNVTGSVSITRVKTWHPCLGPDLTSGIPFPHFSFSLLTGHRFPPF